jgi:predicted RNA-binding Zn ribbon-like protein
MHLSDKYSVPSETALLYDFVNSSDMRIYVENGQQHVPSDELAMPAQLEVWLRKRGLLRRRERVSDADYQRAIKLRSALREYVRLSPAARLTDSNSIKALNEVLAFYPLLLQTEATKGLALQPGSLTNPIALVAAQLFALTRGGRIDRLKMCEADECQWIFFDRSKPGNRRWCSSLICGNRQKTRQYRERLKQ